MKHFHLGLLLFSLISLSTVWAECERNFTSYRFQELTEWTFLSVDLEFAGYIEIRAGSDLAATVIEITASAETQEEADTALIEVKGNDLGSIFVRVTDTLNITSPGITDLAPEDSSGKRFLPSLLTLGVAAGLTVPETRIPSMLVAGSLLLYGAKAEARGVSNCSVQVHVVITVPQSTAVELGIAANGSRVENKTRSNGNPFWEHGTQVIVPCDNSTGLCQSTVVPCTVNTVRGECIDTSQCLSPKTSVAGYCPGAANIRCCVDNAAPCRLSNGATGACRSTTTCSSLGGVSTPGLCAGAANIQCCTLQSCSVGGVSGSCRTTTSCASAGGVSTPGLCAGASNIQCCTPKSGTPGGGSGGSYSSARASAIQGVSFAPMTGTHWPLRQSGTRATICYDTSGGLIQVPSSPVASNFGCSTRKFLAFRSGGARYHSGVDLYAVAGTAVVATEPGTIVNAYPFFENVCCVILQTDSGVVINYGEISCNYVVRRGQRVSAGQLIGYVGDLNCCHPMLHFETYRSGTTQNIQSVPGGISSRLLNPSEYLLRLRERGA